MSGQEKEQDMVRNVRWISLIAGIFLAQLMASAGFADTLPILSVSGPPSVNEGASFAVDVNITNVTNLFAYEFDLSFNPSVVQATNVIQGPFLSRGGPTIFLAGGIDNTNGDIAFNVETLQTPISSGVIGSGTLMTFDFLAVAPGVSTFGFPDLSVTLLTPSPSDPTILTPLDFTTKDGSVDVKGSAAMLEPSSACLLLAGVSALFLLTLTKRISYLQ
jgi:Cohesin domain